MLRQSLRRLVADQRGTACSQIRRGLATVAGQRNFVKIVEVSPRDGLQNEKAIVPTETKVKLVNWLLKAGVSVVEAGSFVSPKWVPQMADTPQVIQEMQIKSGVSYPVLVPNAKGLDTLLSILSSDSWATRQKPTDEIAIFTAATESFTKANTNCTIAESLERLSQVTQRARDNQLKVRGYISVVAGCPYEGAVDAKRVGQIAKELLQMGCYEVSLGDTVGVATPPEMIAVLDACVQAGVPVDALAAHCHDTFGMGLANVLTMVRAGVRTVDSSVGGLGGCPYSPGATGNIDTESVVYALHKEGYETGIDLSEAARIGDWISNAIGRLNSSNAGRAIIARERLQKEKAKL
ncbi:aldolase [Tilletiaria anomala UBC 951]|uniref:hydroxymethylglutaryl-CoA lyase n=1 Tax=Tilletiaria anomala (strain ATCC 24038 / CBS 436.72 / UBC 951) TaxID=1037660 RepID=A0A066W8L2_TILAU|nr:aldolase [Tilletiaria anomala UBC 951]KDN47130.1 aldolase [Tilletiaria anomala UBC 951]